jgi:hypothetical protein
MIQLPLIVPFVGRLLISDGIWLGKKQLEVVFKESQVLQ